MSGIQVIGIILIILGVVVLIYQGVTYTTHETVFKMGPLEANAEKKKTVPIPPIIGVLVLAGGVVMLIAGKRSA